MHEDRVVVFAGGGSGGHLYPAFAMADALVAERPGVRTHFVGSERGIEGDVLRKRGIPHLLVPLQPLSRERPLSNVGIVPSLVRSLFRTDELFRRLRPEMVVLTGGYAAASAGVVAVSRRIPLVMLEPNAWPGVVTRVLAPFTTQLHVAYPEVIDRLRLRPGAARVSGHPIRDLPTLDAEARSAVRSSLGLADDRAVVLVTGGSQGSAAINALLAGALEAVAAGALAAPTDWQLLWAAGPKNHAALAERLGDLQDADWLTLVPYIEDMPRVLPLADLAVGRGGAGTITELMLCGIPSVIIPLPTSAEDHQEHNARALEDAGAALRMRQADATPEGLWGALSDLMADPDRRAAMSAVARERVEPGAAERIGRDLAGLLDEVSGR